MNQNPILISFFNHKGGVSKTTTTFNLGWTLSKMGLKTLIVDSDPQCNLTAYVLGLDERESVNDFYKNVDNDNIYSKIHPIISGKNTQIQDVKPCETLHENLLLVAGHLSMSDLDISLSTGLASGKFLPFATQFIGAFHEIIRETAEKNECKIVLIDMSPSASALNRSILMSSDYFFIPTSPDFFCYQAIQSLGDMLPQWNEDFKPFRKGNMPNPLPKDPPKMLGIISQKYRPYSQRISNDFLSINPKDWSEGFKNLFDSENRTRGIAKSFREWIDKIQLASKDILAKKLKPHNMVIDEDLFKRHVNDEKPYNLKSIGDFNSLIALSQKYSKPVFELTENELNFSGKVLERMKENQKNFENCFEDLAKKTCRIIEDDYPKINFGDKIN